MKEKHPIEKSKNVGKKTLSKSIRGLRFMKNVQKKKETEEEEARLKEPQKAMAKDDPFHAYASQLKNMRKQHKQTSLGKQIYETNRNEQFHGERHKINKGKALINAKGHGMVSITIKGQKKQT
mmetsp:Transcript_12003/g.17851  ORF Transcript_12003/g.17851 Transcript_12003/m.17851 type:complete len:123 (+) Transcript_12003:3175-3543(+)